MNVMYLKIKTIDGYKVRLLVDFDACTRKTIMCAELVPNNQKRHDPVFTVLVDDTGIPLTEFLSNEYRLVLPYVKNLEDQARAYFEERSEELVQGKSVDLGGRRIIKNKRK